MGATEHYLLQPSDDGRGVLEDHSPDLPVLTRGDVSAAVGAVLADDVSEKPHLLASGHPIGELQTHHEPTVWRGGAQVLTSAVCARGELMGSEEI